MPTDHTPTLADGVLAIVKAATDPLHERIKQLEAAVRELREQVKR